MKKQKLNTGEVNHKAFTATLNERTEATRPVPAEDVRPSPLSLDAPESKEVIDFFNDRRGAQVLHEGQRLTPEMASYFSTIGNKIDPKKLPPATSLTIRTPKP